MVQLGPPIPIMSQENAPQTCVQANLMEALPQLTVPYTQMTLGVCQVKQKELTNTETTPVFKFTSACKPKPVLSFPLIFLPHS